jgi:hypothetical protein
MKVVITKEEIYNNQSKESLQESRISFTSSARDVMCSSEDPNEIKLVVEVETLIILYIPSNITNSGEISDILSIKTPTRDYSNVITLRGLRGNCFISEGFIFITIRILGQLEDIEIELLTKEEVREEKINNLLS